MNKYTFIYSIVNGIDDNVFEISSESLEKAVISFAKQLPENISAANIEFIKVLKDEIDLDVDGILEAEKTLARFYD